MSTDNNSLQAKNQKTCKGCSTTYNQKEVERVYGKESMPALLGYCSAQCYTKAVTDSERQRKISNL